MTYAQLLADLTEVYGLLSIVSILFMLIVITNFKKTAHPYLYANKELYNSRFCYTRINK